jgi:2-hydroxychromene-2-carboxylate isomerase
MHPFNPLPALRMATAITAEEDQARFVAGIVKAAWGEGRDITTRETLAAIVQDAGLNATALWEEAHSPAVKERLRLNTEEAVAAGVFGVPTFRVGDEIFWGCDRMDYLRRYLRDGKTMDAGKLAQVLARPQQPRPQQVDRSQVKG